MSLPVRDASLAARWLLPLAALLFCPFIPVATAATCLYISSYHHGYEWNDGIEKGLEAALGGKCRLDRFYLDTKRNQSEEHGRQMALQAKAYIEKTRPDILIAADDNTSKYLIAPYFRNAAIPVVFCGINYSVKPYGYPYRNATGMMEISPVRPLFKFIRATLPDVSHGAFLAADVATQHREFELNRDVYLSEGVSLRPVFVKTMQQWNERFKQLQMGNDILVIGNNAGIADWSDRQAEDTVGSATRILTVTNYKWMRWYAVLAVTKLAEEQGRWAGEVALAVLGGADIAKIPVVANRQWDIFVNPRLMQKSGLSIPARIMFKAVKVTNDAP